ncbi:hypothetical protein ABZ491_23590 [Micromonospora rifamycinica]|uniref:hypothetical protein n=1 Tax=Micromonospora rifamycinica TaxID=291594 RepID=UPI00340659C7
MPNAVADRQCQTQTATHPGDELIDRAGAAGGRIGDTDDYPFMYQRQFDDPDGYHYSPFWMKTDTDPAA